MNHYTLLVKDLNGNESSLIQFQSDLSVGELQSYLEGMSDALRAIKPYTEETGSDVIHKDFVDLFVSGGDAISAISPSEEKVFSYCFYCVDFNLDLGRFERTVNLAMEPNVAAVPLPQFKV